MPPAKRNHDDVQTLKEKLHASNPSSSSNSNSHPTPRGRRTQGTGTQPATGSTLKDVDNASTNSGHTATDASPSHVSHHSSIFPQHHHHNTDTALPQMKWSSQDPAVLQCYRRAYRLDTPSTFSNPLSHVVLGHGIGRFSPTMARPKAQRRVHKDQLALAVRKNFNALGVSESDVIVDWLYKTKHQGTHPHIHTTSRRSSLDVLTRPQTRSSASDLRRSAGSPACRPFFRYPRCGTGQQRLLQ